MWRLIACNMFLLICRSKYNTLFSKQIYLLGIADIFQLIFLKYYVNSYIHRLHIFTKFYFWTLYNIYTLRHYDNIHIFTITILVFKWTIGFFLKNNFFIHMHICKKILHNNVFCSYFLSLSYSNLIYSTAIICCKFLFIKLIII